MRTKDIYLTDIETALREKRTSLSNEARELAQTIISNLRLNQELSIEADKRVLGEVCRALEVESVYSEYGNHWFYRFYKGSRLESCVLVSTPISIFELVAKALKPQTTKS